MAELTADDMLYPKVGQIVAGAVWPDMPVRKVKDIVTELLRLGYAKADTAKNGDPLSAAARNDGAMYWVRSLAYGGAYQEMVGQVSTADVRDEGSGSYLVTQMTLMAELRDQALADFAALVAGDAEALTAAVPRSSQSVRACFENF